MQDTSIRPLYDVLWEVIHALGGARKIGVRLRPDKTAKEAEHWLYNTLNPSRRERMSPEHVLWLLREGRKIGCHAVMDYLCRESGYAKTKPIDSDAELEELRRQHAEAQAHAQLLAGRIDQLSRSAA